MGLYDRQYLREDEFERPVARGPRSVVITLMLINAGIFLLDAFTPRVGQTDWHLLTYWMALDTAAPWAIWRYITAGFAHSPIGSEIGIFHIGFNMLALFIFGRPVEEKYGRSEFLRIYLVAILFSSSVWMLVQLLISPQRSMAVGASGAVAAVIILFVLDDPRRVVKLFAVIPMPAWVLGVMMILIDLSHAFRADSPVGWAAHLGGVAFAAAYFKFGWNFQWIKLDALQQRLGPRRHLKIHRGEDGLEDNSQSDNLAEQADRVLTKLHREGEASLTRRERKILEQYSRRVRQNRSS